MQKGHKSDRQRCPACRGTGQQRMGFLREPCHTCDGMGELEWDD